MKRRLTAAVPAILVAAALGPLPAGADEAYVCDAGRIVYVKPGELEGLKRTDACIAGYYGLTVETPAKPHETPTLSAKAPAARPVPPGGAAKGLAVEREALAAAAIEVANAPVKSQPVAVVVTKSVPTGSAAKEPAQEREARAAAAIEVANAPVKPQPVAVVVTKPMPDLQPAATQVAAASVDFRNVVILNAAPGADRIFHHDK